MFGFGRKREEPVVSPLVWETVSETGLVRPNNEDHLFADAQSGVFCVADGMGGGAEGETASAFVCEAFHPGWVAAGAALDERVDAACNAIRKANARIFAYARERGFREMGSTAVVLVFDPGDLTGAAVVHVGDSRAYRIRAGLAEPLTRDHSVGFELGEFAGAGANALRSRTNPLSHVLTRAVGTQESVTCTCSTIDVRSGDRFVLCTDGLHDVVSDSRLGLLGGIQPLASARERIAREIVRCGAPDNYSYIIVQA